MLSRKFCKSERCKRGPWRDIISNQCPSINGLFAQPAGGRQVSAPAPWNAEPIPLGLCSKNNPRNINYMPVVIFFACLDLEQKSSFMDGH
jgi:hypothetical protein